MKWTHLELATLETEQLRQSWKCKVVCTRAQIQTLTRECEGSWLWLVHRSCPGNQMKESASNHPPERTQWQTGYCSYCSAYWWGFPITAGNRTRRFPFELKLAWNTWMVDCKLTNAEHVYKPNRRDNWASRASLPIVIPSWLHPRVMIYEIVPARWIWCDMDSRRFPMYRKASQSLVKLKIAHSKLPAKHQTHSSVVVRLSQIKFCSLHVMRQNTQRNEMHRMSVQVRLPKYPIVMAKCISE